MGVKWPRGIANKEYPFIIGIQTNFPIVSNTLFKNQPKAVNGTNIDECDRISLFGMVVDVFLPK